jgi:hypothetical protein
MLARMYAIRNPQVLRAFLAAQERAAGTGRPVPRMIRAEDDFDNFRAPASRKSADRDGKREPEQSKRRPKGRPGLPAAALQRQASPQQMIQPSGGGGGRAQIPAQSGYQPALFANNSGYQPAMFANMGLNPNMPNPSQVWVDAQLARGRNMIQQSGYGGGWAQAQAAAAQRMRDQSGYQPERFAHMGLNPNMPNPSQVWVDQQIARGQAMIRQSGYGGDGIWTTPGRGRAGYGGTLYSVGDGGASWW